MSHDSLSDNFFEILWHNAAQYLDKSNLVNFQNKISFWSNMGTSWPKIKQFVLTIPV